MLRPGLLAAVSLILGHVLAWSLGLVVWEFGAIVAGLAAASLALLPGHSWVFSIAFCVFFAGVGAMQEGFLAGREQAARRELAAIADGVGQVSAVTGELTAFPRRTGSGWNLLVGGHVLVGAEGEIIEVKVPVSLRVLATAEGDALISRLVPGERVRALGRLEELPEVSPAGERFGWLAGTGSIARLSVKRLERLDGDEDRSLCQRFLGLGLGAANHAEARLYKSLPGQEAALLAAMTLGRTHHLADERREAFQRAGLMHLFAVSGLHTMLIGGLGLMLLRLFGLKPWPRFVVLLMLLLLFATMVGLRSSVLRAAVLLLAYEGRFLIRRTIEPMALLGTVAAVMLILWPRAVWQMDFQMSFLCASAIVLISPWMFALQRSLGRRFGWNWKAKFLIRTCQILAVSAMIQLFLSPVLARSFGEISLIAPVANALLLPIASFCVYMGFVGILLAGAIPVLGESLLAVLEFPLMAINAVSAWLAEIPMASVTSLPWSPWAGIALYILILTSPLFRLRPTNFPRRTVWEFVPGALALGAFIVWMPLMGGPRDGMDIWFLDVGQGDATLIRTPRGTTVLVDCGPDSSAWMLPRMLHQRSIDEVDILVATHADADHIGGMAEFIDDVPVGRLLVGGSLADTNEFDELVKAVANHRLPVVTTNRGAVLELDGGEVRIEVLHPTEEFARMGEARNDASVVLRVLYGGRSVLLTGDAEADAEMEMIDARVDLQADVLKAGHHGSASSSGVLLLKAVDPEFAVISCGAGNRYGHPHEDLLKRLDQHGINVYRTDQQGSIHLNIGIDGELRWSATRDTPVRTSRSRTRE